MECLGSLRNRFRRPLVIVGNNKSIPSTRESRKRFFVQLLNNKPGSVHSINNCDIIVKSTTLSTVTISRNSNAKDSDQLQRDPRYDVNYIESLPGMDEMT